MIEVRVPATSANLGPGFDCLGIALNLYNYYRIDEIENGLEIKGCDNEFKNENNLIYVSMLKCFEAAGYKHKGISIDINSDIPVSRGLGSSASCIAAGVLAANEISGRKLNTHDMLQIAAEVEGHPDNTSPALLGGMVVSIMDQGRVYCESIKIADGIKFCALIPDFTLPTREARAVLPSTIPYKDGVYNVGRVSFLVAALTNGNFDLVKYACEDKLHQNYRSRLINNYDEIINKVRELDCLGSFLSGAGPTIMTILKKDDYNFKNEINEFLKGLKNKWTVMELEIDKRGSMVNRI